MQATTTLIDYSKLTLADDINARAGGDYETGIDELAALIKAKGLINPLIVRPAKKGKHEIFAGKRRFLAIGKLMKAGDWTGPVECKVRDEGDDEARETSLIENIARLQMHPVQEFRVFAELHAKGADVPALAKRYGVTERIVRQRLALGGLADEILDAWFAGTINADTAQAFAICPHKAQQADAFRKLRKHGNLWPQSVRNHLVKDRPKITDARVEFVGLDRYKAAGGKVVESLFADDGYLEDGKLLDKLVEERLAARCAELLAEGWSFAIPASEIMPPNAHYSWARLQGKRNFTLDERKRLKEIEDGLKAARKAMEYDGDVPEGEDDPWETADKLNEEKGLIEDAAESRGFSAAQKAKSGCVISLTRDSISVTFGLVRGKTPAQLEREKERKKAKASIGAAEDGEPDSKQHISNALAHDITALRTMAAREALATDPELAVRLAAAALQCATGYGDPIRLRADGYRQNRFGPAESDEDEDSFVDVLASLETQERAAAALAVALGPALDLTVYNANALPRESCDAFVALLPGEIYLEAMRRLFAPADYFKRASGDIAAEALKEMGRSPPNASTMKAADLKTLAIEAANEVGWLPVALRHPDYAIGGAKAAKGSRKRAA